MTTIEMPGMAVVALDSMVQNAYTTAGDFEGTRNLLEAPNALACLIYSGRPAQLDCYLPLGQQI